jgi:hypothetical protein
VHATQVRVVGEQTGVTPPHWLSFRQATQTPTPPEGSTEDTSHRGAEDGQCDTSVAVQGAQAPFGRQIGAPGPHSASEAQARQARLPPSQTGVVPPHSPFERQPTQVPAPVSQTGVAPLQRVALVAEHCPQAPAGWQAGSMPPHSLSPAQPRQVRKIGSQTGLLTPQTVASRHSTQTPAGA